MDENDGQLIGIPHSGVTTSASEAHKKLDFATQALQHSNITLTWDDDDPDRVKMLRQKFNKDDLQAMDFKAYLATSSDESEGETVEDMRRRYKSLLQDVAAENEEEAPPEGDMEITFTPGLSEAASELLEKKKKKKEKEHEASRCVSGINAGTDAYLGTARGNDIG